MGLLSAVRSYLRNYPPLRKFVAFKVVPSGLFDRIILNYSISEAWDQRVKLACEAPDNELIPRDDNAGLILRGKQIMHNGLRIKAGVTTDLKRQFLFIRTAACMNHRTWSRQWVPTAARLHQRPTSGPARQLLASAARKVASRRIGRIFIVERGIIGRSSGGGRPCRSPVR